jgi:hypothetical protein
MAISSSTMRFLGAWALSVCTLPVAAASLSDLFSAVPRPPADAATAVTWVEGGKIVHDPAVVLRQAIEAERQAIIALNGGAAPVAGTAVAAAPGDPVELQRAARAYGDCLMANSGERSPQAALAKRKRWLQRALGQQQMEVNRRMRPCPDPCTDPEILAENQQHLQARMRILDTELKTWNALFDDWKKTRAAYVIPGDLSLAAAAGVAEGATPGGRSALASYRSAMLDEVEMLLSITELSVLRAAAITRGLDERTPDAISGATKKTSGS